MWLLYKQFFSLSPPFSRQPLHKNIHSPTVHQLFFLWLAHLARTPRGQSGVCCSPARCGLAAGRDRGAWEGWLWQRKPGPCGDEAKVKKSVSMPWNLASDRPRFKSQLCLRLLRVNTQIMLLSEPKSAPLRGPKITVSKNCHEDQVDSCL